MKQYLATVLFLLAIPFFTWAQCTNDVVSPIPICKDITVYLDNTGNVSVDGQEIDDGSIDNCGIASYTLTGGVPSVSYNCANVGANSLTLIVTDSAGNTATCGAVVTVADTTSPVAGCQSSYSVVLPNNSNGVVTVAATTINGGSTDNCGVTSFSINGMAQMIYGYSNVGVNTAVLTVADNSGNTSSCTALVNVQDFTTPVANCISSDTVYLDSNSVVTLTPSDIDNGSSDASGSISLFINGQSSLVLDQSNLGINLVSLTVMDASGNTSTCQSSITVLIDSSGNTSTRNLQASAVELNLYPNPTNDQLFVETTNGMLENIQLFNAVGQVVYQQAVNNTPQIKVALGTLPKGLYVLVVTTDKGSRSEKVSLH